VRRDARILHTELSSCLGVPLLSLSGELDRHSVEELRGVIQQELAAGAAGLLLECSALTFIDSGGLFLLFTTVKSLKDGDLLGIVGANAGVLKMIKMTGLVDQPGVHVYADLASAKAALEASQT
jgi:anti-sigma B factor antagonist